MITHKSKYAIGDIVFLITDVEQRDRIITQVLFRANGCILYDLSCGSTSSYHYEFEMSDSKDWKKT